MDKNKPIHGQCDECSHDREELLCPICGLCHHCHSSDYESKACQSKIREAERGDFVFEKQVYDENFPKTIICRVCGSDKWIVGTGSYFTAIKCINCKYEVCIHDG
jgi:hypothetical protein